MTLNGCTALGGRDFNLKVAISRKRCEIRNYNLNKFRRGSHNETLRVLGLCSWVSHPLLLMEVLIGVVCFVSALVVMNATTVDGVLPVPVT